MLKILRKTNETSETKSFFNFAHNVNDVDNCANKNARTVGIVYHIDKNHRKRTGTTAEKMDLNHGLKFHGPWTELVHVECQG